jgi:hypothetical protein
MLLTRKLKLAAISVIVLLGVLNLSSLFSQYQLREALRLSADVHQQTMDAWQQDRAADTLAMHRAARAVESGSASEAVSLLRERVVANARLLAQRPSSTFIAKVLAEVEAGSTK